MMSCTDASCERQLGAVLLQRSHAELNQRKWHAAQCPGLTWRNAGVAVRHNSSAYGHRVWKWQPAGGLTGLGTSPCSTRFSRLIAGSGTGTAERSSSV